MCDVLGAETKRPAAEERRGAGLQANLPDMLVGMPGSGGEVILPPQSAYPRVGYCRAGNDQQIVSLVGSGITQRPNSQTQLEGVS